MSLSDKISHVWNAFIGRDPTKSKYESMGISYGYRPDRQHYSGGNEKTYVASVYNRIALDAAMITIQHVDTDEQGRYLNTRNSYLNECLTLDANIDQTGQAMIHDAVHSMLEDGSVAIVPVDTSTNPSYSSSYEIYSLRAGKIVQWYPKHVKVSLYDENEGKRKDIILEKRNVAIIENPFYSIMNEPNSTMQRLKRKLALLDAIDEQSGAGKLNMLIQLPYAIKSEARRKQAEERRNTIEEQLTNNKYGIAYTDSTEHIVQLNRPLDNNMMSQIEYLTSMLYSQLGITTDILDGTANETTMNNYFHRIIEPIMEAIVDEMKRKFLTKTARSQGQSIMYFRNVLQLLPVTQIAEAGDKLTRNEIMSSNEIRQIIGLKPSTDPNADELRNKNIAPDQDAEYGTEPAAGMDISGIMPDGQPVSSDNVPLMQEE